MYLWADGIYFGCRLTDDRPCILVLMGATADGTKELIAMVDGQRESEASWTELLLGLRDRGLTDAPQVATGDGSLGFWLALAKVFPSTKHQRCWVHKMANVLDKLPKTQQPAARSALHEIWMSGTRADATKAFDRFIETYGTKWPGAAACLEKDRAELLAYYDCPAEHWRHLRTSKCDREHVRHGPPPHLTLSNVEGPDQGPRLAAGGVGHGVQAGAQGPVWMAEAERDPETSRADRRHRVRRRRSKGRLRCRGRPQHLQIPQGVRRERKGRHPAASAAHVTFVNGSQTLMAHRSVGRLHTHG